MVKLRFLSGAALFLLASISLSSTLEAKLFLREKAQLERLKVGLTDEQSRSAHSDPIVTSFLKLEPGQTVNDLEAMGVEILNQIGDIYIVAMPASAVEPVSDLKSVKGLQMARLMRPQLDSARRVGKIESIWNGDGLEGYSFDGSNVLIGLFDTGLDPNNPNFGDRVEAVFYYSKPRNNNELNNPAPQEYYGADVETFTTDDRDAYHGTHVLGIMSGSAEKLDESVSYRISGSFTTVKVNQNVSNPYKGVAPGARLMVGCTPTLYNTFIVDGVKRMIDYAKAEGQTPVINLSLGGNSGPHDGSIADYGAYTLSQLAKDAVIVISSGNEGVDDIAITKNFTSSDNTLSTLMFPTATNKLYSNCEPEIDIWGATGDILDVNVIYVDASNGKILKSTPVKSTVSSDDLVTDPILKDYFKSGTIYSQYGIDEDNGRFNAIVTCSDTYVTSAPGSKVYIGVEITGKDGQRADIFVNYGDIKFSNGGVQGLDTPDGNMSINNMACAKGVLAVGATIANPYWATFGSTGKGDGPYQITGYTNKGGIAKFTSFGKLIDGRALPQVVAPGCMIKSSINSYYTSQTSNYELQNSFTVGKLTQNGRTYFWEGDMGTSMAAPFVTGVVALWQQASLELNKKFLTPDEVISLAQKTAEIGAPLESANPLQVGAGTINAYDGIKNILATTAIGNIAINERDDENALLFSISGKYLNVFVAGASSLKVDLVSITGQRVLNSSVNGSDFSQSLAHLSNGIYVLTVTTPEGGHYIKKINLR